MHNKYSGQSQQARLIHPSPSGVPNKYNILVQNTEYLQDFHSSTSTDDQRLPQPDTVSKPERNRWKEKRKNTWSPDRFISLGQACKQKYVILEVEANSN